MTATEMPATEMICRNYITHFRYTLTTTPAIACNLYGEIAERFSWAVVTTITHSLNKSGKTLFIMYHPTRYEIRPTPEHYER